MVPPYSCRTCTCCSRNFNLHNNIYVHSILPKRSSWWVLNGWTLRPQILLFTKNLFIYIFTFWSDSWLYGYSLCRFSLFYVINTLFSEFILHSFFLLPLHSDPQMVKGMSLTWSEYGEELECYVEIQYVFLQFWQWSHYW